MLPQLLKNGILYGSLFLIFLLCPVAAKSETFFWDSYTDIVPTNAPSGINVGKPISNIVYTSSSNIVPKNKMSGIYFVYNTAHTSSYPVGGFDALNGQIIKSSFNGWSTWYGLKPGQTANSDNLPLASDAQGYWMFFYDDKNPDGSSGSDGILGTHEVDVNGNFLYFQDFNERVSDSKAAVSGFTPYETQSTGTFLFTTSIVTEPTTSALTTLSVTTLGGGTNQVTFSVAVSNAVSFSVTFKNSLTNAPWENLGTYSKTGDVTVVTDTNSVAQRFYRVVTP
jgi:hypothetical protein